MGDPLFDHVDDLSTRADRLLEAQRKEIRAQIAAEQRERAAYHSRLLEEFEKELPDPAQYELRYAALEFVRELCGKQRDGEYG